MASSVDGLAALGQQESESSGIGGTRLDHTSSPSGFGERALRVATLPTPQDAAAPTVSASAPERDRRRAAGGDDPDPGQRQHAAGELRGPRPLAEQQDRERRR